ncbi:LysE family translocator [Thiomicrorhabdus sp. ZW0627]|uniref:LysE family translocator n=1 Tax=Thiomicrorhabdus sp. ZW0627 TaxID=3039774 RepID=UPI0024363115|nr:LysE family translocator [Thiomicrorhabdus sp. ZW0627]MDG6773924.1 LysE family translocator [Thiomicrorhabdus sp. ZW0627]
MIPFELLSTFIVATVLIGLSPGPDNLYVLAQSAFHGRKAGIYLTAGLCSGLIVHTSLVALGVAAILKTSIVAFNVLKILGAAYLLYLAWMAFRASNTSLENPPPKTLTPYQLYRRGILMNLSNPKVSIFFLAFLPQFTLPEHGSVGLQVFILGLITMFVTFILFASIALIADKLRAKLVQSPKIQKTLHQITGLVFVALAANLIHT